MREMAWAVGSVMEEVKNLKLDENTLVFFTSDHGPQINYCNEGGDAGIFKGKNKSPYVTREAQCNRMKNLRVSPAEQSVQLDTRN